MVAKKTLVVAAVTSFFGAFIPTLVVLRMMADNNNNGEVYDTVTGRWHIGFVLSVSAVFYLASFLLIFAVAFVLASLWGGGADAS